MLIQSEQSGTYRAIKDKTVPKEIKCINILLLLMIHLKYRIHSLVIFDHKSELHLFDPLFCITTHVKTGGVTIRISIFLCIVLFILHEKSSLEYLWILRSGFYFVGKIFRVRVGQKGLETSILNQRFPSQLEVKRFVCSGGLTILHGTKQLSSALHRDSETTKTRVPAIQISVWLSSNMFICWDRVKCVSGNWKELVCLL